MLTYLAFVLLASPSSNAVSADKYICDQRKFVNVAGARMRESRDPQSKIIMVLRYGAEVCLLGDPVDEKQKVASVVDLKKSGWVPVGFLRHTSLPLNKVRYEATKFKNQKKWALARIWAERAVEIEENKANLDLLALILKEIGEYEKAADVSQRRRQVKLSRILPVQEKATYTIPGGGPYEDNSSWLTLNCEAKQCHLEETTLRAERVDMQGYDHIAKGQKLAAENTKNSILMFRDLDQLKAGPVKTYYMARDGQPPRNPATENEFDYVINNIPGGDLEIIPKLLEAKGNDKIVFFLKHGGQEQELGRVAEDGIFGLSAINFNIVKWIGDLDGDGQIDLITSMDSRAGESIQRTLYLSTMAKGDDMVGPAASFYYWPPNNPGC